MASPEHACLVALCRVHIYADICLTKPSLSLSDVEMSYHVINLQNMYVDISWNICMTSLRNVVLSYFFIWRCVFASVRYSLATACPGSFSAKT